MNKLKNKYLIVLLGPTAVGKTEIAIHLARHLKTEILSSDARQFYREMSIGTAKPTRDELALVKHHFIDHLGIADYYNVSRFEEEGIALLTELHKKHDVVLMTGGSGLYIDAIIKGIDEMPDPNMETREKIKNLFYLKGIEFLQDELKRLDPEYFTLVDRSNPNRMIRALEVCYDTGRSFTSFRRSSDKKRDFKVIKIGLKRERLELNDRINLRVDQMMKEGLLEEVKLLVPHRTLNALNTVGYKEIFEYLDGNIDLEEAIERIKTNTRKYSKRQMTWFKRDEEISWFHPKELNAMIRHLSDNLI